MMHPVQPMEVRALFEHESFKPRPHAEHAFIVRLELARQRRERAARRRAWLARRIQQLQQARAAWRRIAAERQAAQQRQTASIHRLLAAPAPSQC